MTVNNGTVDIRYSTTDRVYPWKVVAKECLAYHAGMSLNYIFVETTFRYLPLLS